MGNEELGIGNKSMPYLTHNSIAREISPAISEEFLESTPEEECGTACSFHAQTHRYGTQYSSIYKVVTS